MHKVFKNRTKAETNGREIQTGGEEIMLFISVNDPSLQINSGRLMKILSMNSRQDEAGVAEMKK